MSRALLSLVVGLGTTSTVVAVASAHRPTTARRIGPHPRAPRHEHLLDQLTISVCRAAGRSIPDAGRRRRLRRLALLVAVSLWIAPPVAVLVPMGAWLQARHATVRGRGRTVRVVVDTLPDAVDLLLLATSAGRSLPIAHPLVADHLPTPVGPALQLAASEADLGRPRADALADALAPLGARAAALGAALGDHLRYGVPLVPTLERLGMELRIDRRRLAEERARRVPVRLLGPLVTCILPALGLLTVVPLLAAAVQSLPT